MKILKRSSNVFNLILFQVFSYIFLHVVLSLKTGYSAISIERFYSVAYENILLVSFLILNMISIFFIKKISYFQVIISSVVISVICFFQFLDTFDKTILFYTLFYIFTSFFFVMIWKLELEESIYNPNFDSRGLRSSGLQKVNVSLSDQSGNHIDGVIQNWSKDSFFLSCEKFELNVNDIIDISMEYQKIKFEFKAKIATQSKGGFGLYVIRQQNTTSLNWLDFYDIISDRGIHPVNV